MNKTGCDFTNSFYKLNKLNLNGLKNKKQDIDDYLKIILQECSSVDEFKETIKPKFSIK